MCISSVGQVLEVVGERASVHIGDRDQWVLASMRPEVRPGDYVVVQTGLILDIISEAEATEIARYERAFDELLNEAASATLRPPDP